MNQNPVYVEAHAVPVEQPAFVHQGSIQAFPVNAMTNSMVSTAPTTFINEAGAREYLSSQKWPSGLQDTFIKNLSRIPIRLVSVLLNLNDIHQCRFFICDDSGSMVSNDGHKLIDVGGKKK